MHHCQHLLRSYYVSQLWDSNCEMKEMTFEVTKYTVSKQTVRESCAEGAGCTYLALDDYARIKQYDDDPTRNCASPFFDVRSWTFASCPIARFHMSVLVWCNAQAETTGFRVPCQGYGHIL